MQNNPRNRLQLRDVTEAWQALPPRYRHLLGILIFVSTAGWLAMSLLPLIHVSWWLAHNDTAFRVRWITWRLVLNLISLASICSFIFWARRRTEAGVRDREDLSQKTVLIVGNNPRLYERAVAATESAGFSVAVVRGAESVLDRLAQGGIDVVIITETMLPDAYGDALVKAVRHGYSEVPIFTFSDPLASPNHEALFSGHKDFRETPHEEGLSLEVFLSRKGYIPDLFLSPPVKPKELVAFVRGVLK